jgi:glycosyltransferase involved in cell wall biosynthesis
MISPTVDIIVPVWNNTFETRACLAAILTHSPDARLIVVDNGSSRETQLMLEEFSEPLGERGLFISSERNVGLVRAINMGLTRSDSDYAVILRPHVQVSEGWLGGLLEAAREGIGSPVFNGSNPPLLPPLTRGCSLMETSGVSFSALALKGEMHMLLGGFDEELDGGDWCLKDYIRRAWSRGYRTSVCSRSKVTCGPEQLFGSEKRILELARSSSARYRERWGLERHYGIYFGRDTGAGSLVDTIESILAGARQGHRFSLLLHHRQAAEFRRMGWNALHTAIEQQNLSLLTPLRDLNKKVTALRAANSEIILVRGTEGCLFPAADYAIPFQEVASAFGQDHFPH